MEKPGAWYSRVIRTISLWFNKREYLRQYRNDLSGTATWLIGSEIYYGGLQRDIPRKRISPHDPRANVRPLPRMVGGDRMYYQAYAEKYAEHLLPIVKSNKPVTLIEIGILNGTGLAMWSELFRGGRVIGLDIDLGHIYSNMENLLLRGAFPGQLPELYELDQFEDNTELIDHILQDDKVDIVIDDGCHYTEAVLRTMRTMTPYLARNFLYFIEDNSDVYRHVAATYPDFIVEYADRLTIVYRDCQTTRRYRARDFK